METKWSLDPDPRSASDPDPSSRVESPTIRYTLVGSYTMYVHHVHVITIVGLYAESKFLLGAENVKARNTSQSDIH